MFIAYFGERTSAETNLALEGLPPTKASAEGGRDEVGTPTRPGHC